MQKVAGLAGHFRFLGPAPNDGPAPDCVFLELPVSSLASKVDGSNARDAISSNETHVFHQKNVG
jgi:hypothetical protein